jgi:anti-anti-sigma factor
MINFVDLHEEDHVRFVLDGELVAGGMDKLRESLKRHIENGATKIVFDMEKVSTLDSAGVGFLAAAHNSLVKVTGSIRTVQLSEDMYNFFVSLRLNTHFNIERRA